MYKKKKKKGTQTRVASEGDRLMLAMKARAATAEAGRSVEADPSCCATTLSTEEYADLLDTAMRYPTPHNSLASVVALAHNGGKANQDGQTTYAALANHKQPLLDCLSYLAQHILHQINRGHHPGNGVYNKYWELQHGYAGDGAEGGRTPSHHTKTPFKLMVVSALDRLPGRVGTAKEIQDTIAATPAYQSALDWSVQKGRKTTPKWYSNCSRALGANPDLFERAGQRTTKHGALPLWKLRQVEWAEQLTHKHSAKAAIPHLGRKHR
ncbi:hypothetical protein WJX72_000584 [[Myrmecia] bisecta]|uniref:Uncharacterized protein n=1 Tax=[Myrmecia] bisecta TaxID=41462 RepID=A0AAW1PMZ3_9CHLO